MRDRTIINITFFVMLIVLSQNVCFGQKATYYWNAAGGGSYGFASNWTPSRTAPTENDTLIFSNGGTYTVSSVTAFETVGKIVVSNNTKVTFTATSAITYTIKGVEGTDLDVASGCEFNLGGSNAITLILGTGATGIVSGSVTIETAAHKIDVQDENGLIFSSGAVFTQNCSGFAFTNAGNPNVAIFESGSTFIFKLGSNPFGLSVPQSKIVFQKGSLYSHQSSNTPSFPGRYYSNFEYKYTTNLTALGLNCDNFTLSDGGVSVTGSATSYAYFIKGDFTIAAGKTFNFSPSNSNQTGIVFGGTSEQKIDINGTLTLGANSNMVVASGATVKLNTGNLSTSGKVKVFGAINTSDKTISGTGSFIMNESALSYTGTTAVNGTSITSVSPSPTSVEAGMLITGLGIPSGTYIMGVSGTTIYLSQSTTQAGTGVVLTLTKVAGTLMSGHSSGINGNILTSTVNISSNSAVVYNGTVAQVTGTSLPSSIKKLTINNLNNVTLSAATTVSNELAFINGKLSLDAYDLTIASSGFISGVGADKFVVTSGLGMLKMNTNNGTVIYPIGSSVTSYSPFITTNNTAGDVLDVYVHNSISNTTLDDTKCVQLEWLGVEGASGGNTGTESFQWNSTDQGVNFDPAQPVYLGVWDGSKYKTNLVTVSGTNPYTAIVNASESYSLYPVVLGNFGAFPASAPDLSPDITNADVDHNIEITFSHDALWESAITKVSVNGSDLASTDWELLPPSKATTASIILKPTPTGNEELKKSGTWNIIVYATGYPDATLTQLVACGALAVANSTISNPVLSPGTSKTVTILAKDQYGNPVSGYIFKYDATIKNDDNTSSESYTIAGTITGSSVSDVSLSATDALGNLSFDIVLPATIDPLDGILVQVKLNDGTTNFGSEFKYYEPKLTATATLNESTLNNATIVLTLQNESFFDNTLDKSNFVLHDAPIGLAISDVIYITDTQASLTLAFDGTDFDIDVANFNISINGSELLLGNSLTSNDLTITAVTLATVATNTEITSKGSTTATWGGSVTSNGGAPLIQMGVCWNTTGDPTISDSKTEEIAKGSNPIIVGAMTGLTPVTKYYVRAYATNYDGTSYGDVYDFTTYAPAPSFTATYPKYANTSITGFDVVVNADAIGTAYYIVVASGATAPTSAEVKAAGNSINIVAASTDYTATVSGLMPSTAYDVYFVTENSDATVLMDTPVKIAVTTIAALAPNFTATYPKSANIGITNFDVIVNTDAPGKAYYLMVASGATAPTSAEIKTANNAIAVDAAATDYSVTINGLTENTSYDIYFVTENITYSVLMDTPIKISVTTASIPTYSIHDIQFTTDASGDSPHKGEMVRSTGTITAVKYNSTGVQQGFYIQDGVGAWNGVYVSTTTPTVSVGYIVTVTGTIMENSTFTQFSPVDNVNLDNTSNTTLPDAYEVTTEAAKNEMYEGVLVVVKRALCSSNNGSGTNVVSDGSGDLTVYKNLYSTLSLTVDHRYNITGILSWFVNSSIYALFPRDINDIDDVTGINDNYNSKLAVYPNPFTNEIRFDGSQNITCIIITSVTGQVVKKETILNGSVTTNEIPAGIYFVTLVKSNGDKVTVKMVKQ